MKFNIIYVEDKIRKHKNALAILERIKFNKIIYCKNYKEVFNPRNQNFRVQKKNPSLILAKKEHNLILKTPEKFKIGYQDNYYFSHMLNCIYDCQYCFLQGMFSSANYVIFVNYEDFLDEISKMTLKIKNKICFFSGYDCDSLALEKITFFLSFFLERFEKIKNAFLEVRTKSVKIDIFKKKLPIENVIIALSLNTENVINKFEIKTPSLEKRIDALRQLQKIGWNIGLRFDPFILIKEDINSYQDFFKNIFTKLNADKIHSVTIGRFKMPKNFVNRFLSTQSFGSNFFDCNHFSGFEENYNFLQKELCKFIDKKKIFFN